MKQPKGIFVALTFVMLLGITTYSNCGSQNGINFNNGDQGGAFLANGEPNFAKMSALDTIDQSNPIAKIESAIVDGSNITLMLSPFMTSTFMDKHVGQGKPNPGQELGDDHPAPSRVMYYLYREKTGPNKEGRKHIATVDHVNLDQSVKYVDENLDDGTYTYDQTAVILYDRTWYYAKSTDTEKVPASVGVNAEVPGVATEQFMGDWNGTDTCQKDGLAQEYSYTATINPIENEQNKVTISNFGGFGQLLSWDAEISSNTILIPSVDVQGLLTIAKGVLSNDNASIVWEYTTTLSDSGVEEVCTGTWTKTVVTTPEMPNYPTHGLGHENITRVYVSDGVIYAGTSGGGVSVVQRDGSIKRYTKADGLGDNRVPGLYVSDGVIYAGTRDGGVSVIQRDGSIKRYTKADGLAGEWVESVYVSDGVIYVGGDGGVSVIQKDESIKTYKLDIGHGLYVSDGVIYAGTRDGLAVIQENGSIKTYTEADGLGSNYVASVYVSDGVIYAATWGGLAVIQENGSIKTYTEANGLPGMMVFRVHVSDGVIYAGTSGGGVSVIQRDGSVKTYTEANGLGDNHVRSVYVSEGVIYVGTANGLSISHDGGESFITITK